MLYLRFHLQKLYMTSHLAVISLLSTYHIASLYRHDNFSTYLCLPLYKQTAVSVNKSLFNSEKHSYTCMEMPKQQAKCTTHHTRVSATYKHCSRGSEINISGTTCATFTKFLCMLAMVVARSSSGGVAIHHVLPVL